MANRPNFLCQLEKGKLVDTQAGFVDTFNYVASAIDNLEGGKNCTVDWTLPDHPVINVELPENETGGGSGEGVYDVVDDQGDGSRLRIEYNDGRDDSYIDLSAGGGNVQFSGTSGTTDQGTRFTFAKESNSNVTVTCTGTTIKLGVYYI